MKSSMKKRFALILAGLLIFGVLAGCSKGEPKAEEAGDAKGDKVKIGMAVQDITNPTWAGICENAKIAAEAEGYELTYVSCESKIAKQIEQVENFISNQVNLLIIQPADPKGIEDVAKRAQEAGIKVISWDDIIDNCDVAFAIDNYKLGEEIGKEAAKFIKDKHDGKCEVAVLDYPQLPILLERGKGIVDVLKKEVPDAKIVAQQPAINPTEGQSKMETIFQSNPDVKVVCCIGGGGAVGANEAAKTLNKIADDFGIFAADGTPQELAAI